MSADGKSPALAALLRWEASGAAWRTRSVTEAFAVVDLLTCDGGEVVGQLDSLDSDFIAYVCSGGSAAARG